MPDLCGTTHSKHCAAIAPGSARGVPTAPKKGSEKAGKQTVRNFEGGEFAPRTAGASGATRCCREPPEPAAGQWALGPERGARDDLD